MPLLGHSSSRRINYASTPATQSSPAMPSVRARTASRARGTASRLTNRTRSGSPRSRRGPRVRGNHDALPSERSAAGSAAPSSRPARRPATRGRRRSRPRTGPAGHQTSRHNTPPPRRCRESARPPAPTTSGRRQAPRRLCGNQISDAPRQRRDVIFAPRFHTARHQQSRACRAPTPRRHTSAT